MSLNNSLVRFAYDGDARLGLIRHGQLYDLTTAFPRRCASLSAWLQSIAGAAQAEIAALLLAADAMRPLSPLETLFDPEQEPRQLKPIDCQEVWACGVTYEMSREARMRESQEPTIYGRVYDAPRPELFFKATPHRVVTCGEAVGIRGDSTWDVPEAELALLVTPALEIVGYTIGNDMSSRDIEGENPLYLPQAKVYDRCCALASAVRLAVDFDPLALDVRCTIERGDETVFEGTTLTSTIHRPLQEMVDALGCCNSIPEGAYVLTGTGIVPPDTFTLQEGDLVRIAFSGLGELVNPVVRLNA